MIPLTSKKSNNPDRKKSVDDSIEKVIKKWEKQYGRNFKEELSRGFSENDDNYRQAIEHGEERSSIYDDDVEHSGENKKVFGLGESKNSRRQNQLNTDESTLGGNENRQGNGTTGLNDHIIEGKKSAGGCAEYVQQPCQDRRERFSSNINGNNKFS